MLGSIGAVVNPDVHADVKIEHDLTLEAGSEARPTQPPHPSLVVNISSGYPEDLETFGTPDTVDIADMYRNFSVDVTLLASSVDVTSCPDMSDATSASMFVDTGTCVYANIGDRGSLIRNRSLVDPGALREIRNPSLVESGAFGGRRFAPKSFK